MSEQAGEIKEIEQPQRAGRFILRFFLALIMLVVTGGILAATGGYLVYQYVTGAGVPGEPVAVTIPEGVTGRQAGGLVADAGLVEHELFFRLAMRLDKSGATIKHGEHLIPRGSSPAEVLRYLQQPPKGAPGEFKITIPEGLTIAQIAERTPDPAGFLAAIAARTPQEAAGIEAPSLEGFLMPNTYHFDAPPTGEQLVQQMLQQFRGDWAALSAEFPEAAHDPLRVITIASLIEEEARVEEERALVSAVIHNRLKSNRPLQMDSTLQFALNKYGQRLLDADKQVDSPYNTYKYPGLPPGPISNPGRASLRAALAPADVKYLYFVSNADGKTHTFSNTLKEHEAAVAKFRKEIREQRRELREQAESSEEAGSGR